MVEAVIRYYDIFLSLLLCIIRRVIHLIALIWFSFHLNLIETQIEHTYIFGVRAIEKSTE